MTTIREASLEFNFGTLWEVCKYDENGSYYKTLIEKKVKPTKAVDFLCLHRNFPLLMLEAKDFSLGVPEMEKFDKIPNSVAIKVRDTIAGIVGGANQASDQEQSFFMDSYRKMANPPRVIYFFEDLASPSRPPERTANKRDVLLKELKQHLRWLTREIVVVGLNDYRRFISDLTVRRI